MDYITPDEAAELLGCHRETAMRMAREGKIPYYKPSYKSFLFRRDEVLAYIEKSRRDALSN